jgi:hypothetical protein
MLRNFLMCDGPVRSQALALLREFAGVEAAELVTEIRAKVEKVARGEVVGACRVHPRHYVCGGCRRPVGDVNFISVGVRTVVGV